MLGFDSTYFKNNTGGCKTIGINREDGNLKEPRNRHSTGPRRARRKYCLEMEGSKVENSVTGLPVVAVPVIHSWSQTSPKTVAQNDNFFFNISSFNVLAKWFFYWSSLDSAETSLPWLGFSPFSSLTLASKRHGGLRVPRGLVLVRK